MFLVCLNGDSQIHIEELDYGNPNHKKKYLVVTNAVDSAFSYKNYDCRWWNDERINKTLGAPDISLWGEEYWFDEEKDALLKMKELWQQI